VTIVSLKRGEIQGVRHDIDKTIKVKVERTIDEAVAEEFDAVHLPGGTVNADSLRMVPEVQDFLRAMQVAGKPISAICHAPWELVFRGARRWPDLDKLPLNSRRHPQCLRHLGRSISRSRRQLG